MDAYYSQHAHESNSSSSQSGTTSKAMREIDKSVEVGIEEWGTTANPFEHQTQALKARIFAGANKVEFEFFGTDKGRKEAATPESFGKRDRMDMRELAEINEVETTTHATVGVQGLSGLDMRQGGFEDTTRKQAIDEIKRAIHFAAEATTGGAVVFHTGEAPRSLVSRWKDDKGNALFKMYPEEDQRELHYLVDPVTKKMQAIKENDRIAVPIFKRGKDGKPIFLKDENGQLIEDELLKEYDELDKGRTPIYDFDERGNIKTELIDFKEWKKRRIEEYKEKTGKSPGEEKLIRDFYQKHALLQVQYNLNFGKGHEQQYKEGLERREKVLKALQFYKELMGKVPTEDRWKFEVQKQPWAHLIPQEVEDPVKYLQETLWDIDRNISYTRELAVQGRRQARETLDSVKRSVLAHDFAVGETAKSMAELGVYAWQLTNKAHSDYKKGEANFDIKNPIYIAPENLFPETYGSHPDELKDIVLKGRKEMTNELVKTYKLDEEKAKKLAKEHIKATFDISHANVWRKYFQSKNGETVEDRDKRFNKWLLGQTKKLLDEGIIGHIHVSDNFGFHDEHLTAGDGNAPIKEFIKQAKEAGLKEFIVESGSFNPMTSLQDTWMHFDSPVYAMHMPGFTQSSWTDPSIGATRHGWNNFYRSYFGRTEGPRYVVGEFAPSEDFKGAPFYSGLGID